MVTWPTRTIQCQIKQCVLKPELLLFLQQTAGQPGTPERQSVCGPERLQWDKPPEKVLYYNNVYYENMTYSILLYCVPTNIHCYIIQCTISITYTVLCTN